MKFFGARDQHRGTRLRRDRRFLARVVVAHRDGWPHSGRPVLDLADQMYCRQRAADIACVSGSGTASEPMSLNKQDSSEQDE